MTVHRGRLIVLAVGAIVFLAVLGIYQLDPIGFKDNPADYLYRVVQLFAAEGDWTAGHEELPLALELARFLAPIVTIASLIVLFAEGIWTALINMRVRFYKKHVVVVGLSSAALVFIRSCRRRRVPVVVIEMDPANKFLGDCRRLYVPVLLGDAKLGEWLRRARINNARCLISFINFDDDNIELSLRIQEVVDNPATDSDYPLKVILQVNDMQLGNRLENYPKFFDYPQRMEVRFFNLNVQAARSLFRDFFPEVYADALGMDQVHLVVLGYGQLGKHVVQAALKQAHFANHKPLHISVLDPDAKRARAVFERECPSIELAADVEFHDIELTSEVLRQQLEALDLGSATMFVTCVGSDADNMSLSLALRQLALLALVPNAPVFVSLPHSRGLAQLVESGRGNPEIPDGLYPFGMIEQLLKVDEVVNERLDEIAIALHENYLSGLDEVKEGQASHRPWGLLPEVYRNYTRAQADHIGAKLRASGHLLVRKQTDFVFSAAEVSILAEMEKKRWNAERASLGWSYAQERSDLAKVHPDLLPWKDTTTAQRAYDYASVEALPDILQRRLSMGIAQQIIIGITGHRAHRLIKHQAYVETEVRMKLQQIAQRHVGAEFAVFSALADGSDRLVADLALEILGAKLYVALPLPYEIYKRSFGYEAHISNQASNEEFQRFVGRASMYFEMPLGFGGVQVLEQDNAAGEQARSQQYALAGSYIASRSHELIAIWDGQDARGVGGTAEVVHWRTEGQVPQDFRFAGHFFPALKMTPPHVITIPS